MVSTKSDLKDDVRQFTGYTSEKVLSIDGLDTSYRRAKRHISIEKALEPAFNWFSEDNPEAQEALFWYTCLFAKIQTGEIDSQDLQVGAVDEGHLPAEETQWYQKAESALRSLKSDGIFQSSRPVRNDREYTAGSFNGGDNGGGGSDTEVDGSNL